jgi:CRP-like cAMP-binding protein
MERNWRKDELALLESTFLFQGLPREKLLPLLEEGRMCRRRVHKGEVIYSPVQYERSIGVLLTGSVLVTKDRSGGPPLVISVLNKGDLFGAGALFNDEPDYVTTLTARANCSLVLFNQEQVAGMMREHPQLAANYIRYLSNRVRFLSNKIDILVAGSGEQKLAHYLATHMDEGGVVRLDCSLTELTKRLHMGRASLYRAIDRLEASGTLHREGKQMTILEPKRLQLG